MKHRRAIYGLAVCVLIGGQVLIGCSDASTATGAGNPAATAAGTEAPTAQPSGSVTPSEEDAYRSKCEAAFKGWLPAEVRYPEILQMRYGDTITYTAKIDFNKEPAPVPPPSTVRTITGARIAAKCSLSAKLHAVNSRVTVPSESDLTEGWIYHDLTPTNVMEWSWTVKGDWTGTGRVTLLVMPSIDPSNRSGDQVIFYGDSTINVTGNPLQRLWTWVSDNRAVVIGLSAALVLVAGWLAAQYDNVAKFAKRHRWDRVLSLFKRPKPPAPPTPPVPTSPSPGLNPTPTDHHQPTG